MKTDGTYIQDRQAARVAQMLNGESHSFDLSAATDRFPISLQLILVEEVFGAEIANA